MKQANESVISPANAFGLLGLVNIYGLMFFALSAIGFIDFVTRLGAMGVFGIFVQISFLVLILGFPPFFVSKSLEAVFPSKSRMHLHIDSWGMRVFYPNLNGSSIGRFPSLSNWNERTLKWVDLKKVSFEGGELLIEPIDSGTILFPVDKKEEKAIFLLVDWMSSAILHTKKKASSELLNKNAPTSKKYSDEDVSGGQDGMISFREIKELVKNCG